jgi:hypothetical protein
VRNLVYGLHDPRSGVTRARHTITFFPNPICRFWIRAESPTHLLECLAGATQSGTPAEGDSTARIIAAPPSFRARWAPRRDQLGQAVEICGVKQCQLVRGTRPFIVGDREIATVEVDFDCRAVISGVFARHIAPNSPLPVPSADTVKERPDVVVLDVEEHLQAMARW